MKRDSFFLLPAFLSRFANIIYPPRDFALCCEMWGWKVKCIRSDHTVAERNAIIAEFNDTQSNIDALFSTMDLSAFGVNMHLACNKGIIVQPNFSMNQIMQIIGRLIRIDQRREVEWIIYNMAGMIYDRMFITIFTKYVHQLGVEARIHKSIRGIPASIAAYSHLQQLFNMPNHKIL